ncbi:MAG: toxic anion resistance protein [Epsilonproteobacteria bacterium]|nr:toxic anion resistance protein [Campylobacterota bacterium]
MEKQDIEQKSEEIIENVETQIQEAQTQAQEIQEDLTDTLEETEEALEEVTPDLNALIEDEGIINYETAPQIDQTKMEIVSKEINIRDPHTVIFFGAKAQENINRVSESMLEGVKNKELGTAGDSLNNLVASIKGFDLNTFNPNQKQGFFSKMLGFATPVQKFIGKYEDVRQQVDTITDELEQHKTQLLTDITSLDRLYDVNFEYFKELELYIAAGVHKLNELDNELIPQLETEANGKKKMIKTLGLKDIRATRDDLERRVHDLRLSRQVAMQSLPSIRLVQENDKALITKISSTLVNTVPLWKNQLAQTITIYRSGEAAKAVTQATDLTNDLLEQNAENLQEVNREVRTQVERGVYDIESIKKANTTLIETINESLEIANKGKEARAAAEEELVKVEAQLHDALLAAGKIRR